MRSRALLHVGLAADLTVALPASPPACSPSMRWPCGRPRGRGCGSGGPGRHAGAAGAGAAPVALWRPFFANAVVALGRLPSSAPVALYYNPLLDVAVATLWEKQDGGLATPQHLREAFP